MDELLERARAARETAYDPYSGFAVGAAVETADGPVFAGANVETVNYSNSLHAEEVAVGKAAVEGHRRIVRVAVSGADADGLRPCGACRQTLAEFCARDALVVSDQGRGVEPTTERLEELLPHAMVPRDLMVDPDRD